MGQHHPQCRAGPVIPRTAARRYDHLCTGPAVLGVNLTGFFMLTQRTITEMLKRNGGHIVNITTTLVDYANSSVPSAPVIH
ncbi:MAG: SDR family NAD(P)-dependent oxidoreductase [Pseudonocardiaceae bacterium]